MLLIHNSLNFHEIPVNSKLEAVAAMISTNDKNIIIYNKKIPLQMLKYRIMKILLRI